MSFEVVLTVSALRETFAMTIEAEVGRTVPAERADPLLITLFPSFKEPLSHRGAEGTFLPPRTSESLSLESSLMRREERKEGSAKVEQNTADFMKRRVPR